MKKFIAILFCIISNLNLISNDWKILSYDYNVSHFGIEAYDSLFYVIASKYNTIKNGVATDSNYLSISTDGGLNWHKKWHDAMQIPNHLNPRKLTNWAILSKDIIVVGVQGGLILRTTNGDDEGDTTQCVPSCHWSGEVNGEFGEPILGRLSPEVETKNPENYDFALSSSQDADAFTLLIKSKETGKAEIGVYDLNGNMISNMDSKLKSGRNEAIISTSGLENGVYVYSIVINGIKITTGKFVIAR